MGSGTQVLVDKAQPIKDYSFQRFASTDFLIRAFRRAAFVNDFANPYFLVFNLVKTFNDFSESNDLCREHDFGAFDFKGGRLFWKIDYYDNDLECGSEDPEKTVRVMTVMMAHEY